MLCMFNRLTTYYTTYGTLAGYYMITLSGARPHMYQRVGSKILFTPKVADITTRISCAIYMYSLTPPITNERPFLHYML